MISKTKIVLILGTLYAMANNLYAQTNWDSTYRPDIYRARVDLFRAMPTSKKSLVFIGDSITFWGDWLELSGNKNVKNRGIPGDTSFGLLERLSEAVSSKPSVVFIMIGINDLARGVPSEILLNNYKRMLDTIRVYAPGTRVYFQSILPVNETVGKLSAHDKRAAEIPVLNHQLKTWATTAGAAYIDLFDICKDEYNMLRKDFTWDGVHLTIEGYQAWLGVLQKNKILK